MELALGFLKNICEFILGLFLAFLLQAYPLQTVRISSQRVVDHRRIKQSHEARHRDLLTEFTEHWLHLRGLTMGAPSHDTATIPHSRHPGAGTRRRLPCVPVLLCWHRLQPWGAPHYMRAQGYNVSDSNTIRILPTLQLQVQCNPTSTQYSTQTQQTPHWRIFVTTLNLSTRQTSMYSGLELSSS